MIFCGKSPLIEHFNQWLDLNCVREHHRNHAQMFYCVSTFLEHTHTNTHTASCPTSSCCVWHGALKTICFQPSLALKYRNNFSLSSLLYFHFNLDLWVSSRLVDMLYCNSLHMILSKFFIMALFPHGSVTMFLEITFIQQGCITWSKGTVKTLINVTKDFSFK